MSVNRENAIWASPTGGYKMGLYSLEYTNMDSPDFDYEWDVEYDYSSFSNVIIGTSADNCIEIYCRSEANAGGYNIYDATDDNAKTIERFEAMHNSLKERIASRKAANSGR